MSDATPLLSLPYIAPAQAQKHVTHNEALRKLDALVQLSVLGDAQNTPPANPAEGDRYIVAPGGSGDWAGQDLAIASFEQGLWQFTMPQEGWHAWVGTTSTFAVFEGGGWSYPLKPRTVLDQIQGFGLNAASDAGTPFVVRAPKALWDAVPAGSGGSGDMIQAINRETVGDDAGLVFQTGYTTHALVGFFGTGALRLSVSEDGTTFQDAAVVDPAEAILRQPQRPSFKVVTNYDNPLTTARWSDIALNQSLFSQNITFDALANTVTVLRAGVYMIGGSILFKEDTTTDVRLFIGLTLNGAEVPDAQNVSGDVQQTSSTARFASVLSLQAGDTLKLRGRSLNDSAYAGAMGTTLWGYMLP